MNVYTIVGIIFLELIAAAVASISFLLFLREFTQRRIAVFAWFAGASAMLFLTMVGLFLSQYFGSTGDVAFTRLGLEVLYISTALHALCVVQGAFRLGRMNALLRHVLTALCAGTALFVVYTFWSRTPQLQFIKGIAFTSNGDPLDIAGAVACGTVLVSIFLLALAIRRDARKHSKKEYVSATFFGVCAFGIVETAGAFLQATMSIDVFVLATLGMLPFYAIALTLAVIAAADNDYSLKINPFKVLNRDLLLKAIALIGAVMFLNAYSIQVIVSNIFVDLGTQRRQEVSVHTLDKLMISYNEQAKFLYAEAHKIANDETTKTALSATVPGDLDPATTSISENQVIADKRFSSALIQPSAPYPAEFSDSSLVTNVFVRKSFHIGAEQTPDGIWMLRALAPVFGDVGIIGASLVEVPFSDVFERASLPPGAKDISFGFTLPKGDIVFSSASPLDRLTTNAIRSASFVGSEGNAVVNEQTEEAVFLRRLMYGNGSVFGYFYVTHDSAKEAAAVFKYVALITFLIITALMLTLAVIYLVLRSVLRPIKKLHTAVEKLEKENYGFKIGGHGPDEVGQLAEAFDKMQDTISHRTTDLKDALREQRDFVDHMAHELRTPVNIFRWTLEMMRYGDTGKMTKEQLELLEQLNQTNERLQKVSQNIQDAIRIDRGEFKLELLPVVIEDVIDEAAGVISVRSRIAGVTFHWSHPQRPMPRVRADRSYLLKTVSSIISNAVKFTAKGGHVEVSMELTDESSPSGKRGTYVMVSVEDNGIGIPKDEQKDIFRKFYRAKNVIKADVQGAGLGMYIAAQVIGRHGGEIWLTSKEESGSTFTFTIPIDETPGIPAKTSPLKKI